MAGSANKSKLLPNKSPTDNAMQPDNHGLLLDFSFNKIDARTKLGRAQKLLQDYLRG